MISRQDIKAVDIYLHPFLRSTLNGNEPFGKEKLFVSLGIRSTVLHFPVHSLVLAFQFFRLKKGD
jgi:hypothetical protein